MDNGMQKNSALKQKCYLQSSWHSKNLRIIERSIKLHASVWSRTSDVPTTAAVKPIMLTSVNIVV
ncbi:hypothetical protein HY483_03830 [Candidatus Woesearchaeota archaeon]|nr:hypothetical protein [Candidatus Woesearchaeota archaeon]